MQETPTNGTAGNGTSPTDGIGGTLADLAEQFRQLIEELTTTQGRLAVSAAVLVVTVIVGVVVLPYVIRWIRRFVDNRLLTGRVGDTADLLGDYVPTTFSELLLRTVQVGLLIVALIALLVVWGLVDVAVAIASGSLGFLPDLVALSITMLILTLAFIASDQLKRGVARFGNRADRITDHQEEIAIRVGQVGIAVTAVASILTLWGWELTGLLVGAGFLGIVVGFAARQTLGSLIAGFVLMFSRPFTIGDWVQIGETEGVVTDITMFNTRLENFDGEFLVIPNDMVSNSTVTNRSQKGLLRLRQDVGIDYGDDPEEAMEVAIEAMNEVEAVVDAPSPQVIPKGFGESAILLEMRFWIDHPTPPRKWKAVSAVVREVKAAFDEAGITVPFPQRTLSDRPGSGEEELERTVTPDADSEGGEADEGSAGGDADDAEGGGTDAENGDG